MRRRLLFLFGTRPEAVKLAPVILQARQRCDEFHTSVVVTAQHREMLDDVLRAFAILPDRDLNIMAPGQSLFHVTSRVFESLEGVLEELDPDVVVVQGDTTTVFAGAVAAFYAGRPVAHVEAGLRTGELVAPFPEEANRKMASCVTRWHFAPTESARRNLLREGYENSAIHVTGNTVIDALLWMVEKQKGLGCPLLDLTARIEEHERMVLITGHRRENFGEPFARICESFRQLAQDNPDVLFVYPVHLNPNVQHPVRDILGGIENFLLLRPLPYPDFVWFLRRAYLVITDSGGVQEEAPALGKPVLVTRRITERPEAVDAGVVKLVGDDGARIHLETTRLLGDPDAYAHMARGVSPYGDGHAAGRILDVLRHD